MKRGLKTTRGSFAISEETFAALKELAMSEGISFNELLNQVLDEYVAKKKPLLDLLHKQRQERIKLSSGGDTDGN